MKKSVIKMEIFDIVISIFNQEKLIERVLFGIFKNTTTPFNLILVFDGCTDKTEMVALKYIKQKKPELLRSLIMEHAANVYETKANNIGFKKANSNFMITVQDDMVVNEIGWERRLTYPLRIFSDMIAVSARTAQNMKVTENKEIEYVNRCALELGTLPRNTLAIRDVINRGPVAFNMIHLRELDYLNEKFAPSDLDDADLCLRAWKHKQLRCGAFWIDYISKLSWGKCRAKDSTIYVGRSISENECKIANFHHDYLEMGVKHDQDIIIKDEDIDYIKINRRQLKMLGKIKKRPLIDDQKSILNTIRSTMIVYISFFSKNFAKQCIEIGIKKSLLNMITEHNRSI